MLNIGKKVGRNGINVHNDVMLVQVLLNANIDKLPQVKPLKMDGKNGTKTEGAIEAFQELVLKMKSPDSRVDPGGATIKELSKVAKLGAPANLVAKYEHARFAKKDNAMKIGRISVGNETFYFVCGGFGRGYMPVGEYCVTEHRNSRSGTSYSTDGIGYSFAVSDKKDPRFPKGPKRTELRIHPDGGRTGTNGCIGILGGRETQELFRSKMKAAIRKGKARSPSNSVILKVK